MVVPMWPLTLAFERTERIPFANDALTERAMLHLVQNRIPSEGKSRVLWLFGLLASPSD